MLLSSYMRFLIYMTTQFDIFSVLSLTHTVSQSHSVSVSQFLRVNTLFHIFHVRFCLLHFVLEYFRFKILCHMFHLVVMCGGFPLFVIIVSSFRARLFIKNIMLIQSQIKK